MPLIYSQSDVLLGLSAPYRTITTPSKSTGIQVMNAANLTLNVQTPTGGVPVPPYTVYNIPIEENAQISFNVVTVGSTDATYVADFVDVQFSFEPGFALSVTALPVTVPSGTSTTIPNIGPGAVAAGAPLLSGAYTVGSNGTIVLAITLAAGAAGAILEVSRNGGTFYGELNNGAALAASIELDLNLYVKQGDVVQFQFSAATNVGQMEFFFVADQ